MHLTIQLSLQEEHCSLKPIEKCFNINVETCIEGTRNDTVDIDYLEQKVQDKEPIQDTHCVPIHGRECTNYTVTETFKKPVQKHYNRTIHITKCYWTKKPTPGRWVLVPQHKTIYKQCCYKVPKVVCTKIPCYRGGHCQSGYKPCSYDHHSSTVCPETVDGGAYGHGMENTCKQVQFASKL